ncbi:hypothetical protein CEXT_53521 [Caerostris extrusa]|uniref:Uncharacterized protein n=1 Tax=Caerostris extrusa TaxID=172846 RepID=A0AAV4TUN5_CAEEX|nr:hypothetical protein CEXT_53521 [Caerostris extrusa]
METKKTVTALRRFDRAGENRREKVNLFVEIRAFAYQLSISEPGGKKKFKFNETGNNEGKKKISSSRVLTLGVNQVQHCGTMRSALVRQFQNGIELRFELRELITREIRAPDFHFAFCGLSTPHFIDILISYPV